MKFFIPKLISPISSYLNVADLQYPDFFAKILPKVPNNRSYPDFRGVDKQLFSSSSELFEALLLSMSKRFDEPIYLNTITNVFKMTLNHCGGPFVSDPIWKVLLKSLKNNVNSLKLELDSGKITRSDFEKSLSCKLIVNLLNLISEGSTLRKGSRVGEYKDLLNSIDLVISTFKPAFNHDSDSEDYSPKDSDILSSISSCLSSILMYCPSNYIVTSGRLIMFSYSNLLEKSHAFNYGFQLILVLGKMNWSHFHSICLPLLVDLSNSCWRESSNSSFNGISENNMSVLLVWSHLIRFGPLKDPHDKAVSQISNGKVILISKETKSDSFLRGITNLIKSSSKSTRKVDYFAINCGMAINTLFDATSMSLSIIQISSVNLGLMSQEILGLIDSLIFSINQSDVDISQRSNNNSDFPQYLNYCQDLYFKCSLLGQTICIYSSLISQSCKSNSEKAIESFSAKGLQLWVKLTKEVLKFGVENSEDNQIKIIQKIGVIRKNPCLLNSLSTLILSLQEVNSFAVIQKSKNSQAMSNFSSEIKTNIFNFNYIMDNIVFGLSGNLSSFNKELRRATLNLIMSLSSNVSPKSPSETSNLELLNRLSSAENSGISLNEYKDKMNHVRSVVSTSLNNESINQNVSKMSANLIVSFLGLNLSLIWKELNILFSEISSDNRPTNKFKAHVWDALFRIVNKVYVVKQSNIHLMDYIEPMLTSTATNLFNDELLKLSNLDTVSKPPLSEDAFAFCSFNNKFNSIQNYYRDMIFSDKNTSENDASDNEERKGFDFIFSIHGVILCDFLNESDTNSDRDTAADLIKPKIDYNAIVINSFNAMGSSSSLASQNTDLIILIFRKMMLTDWRKNIFKENDLDNGADTFFDFGLGSELENSRRARLNRLHSILTLISKVGRIKKFPIVNEICLKLLSSGDLRTQKAALDVVLAYNSQMNNKEFSTYSDDLKNLLNKDTIKDTILNFSLDSRISSGESKQIQIDDTDIAILHEPQEVAPFEKNEVNTESKKVNVDNIIPVLLRILFGRLVSKEGNRSNKTSMKTRRTIILKVLTSLKPDEISFFGSLILEHFGDSVQPLFTNDPSMLKEFIDSDNIFPNYVHYLDVFDSIRNRTKIGFLTLATEMVKQLGVKVTPIFHKLITTNLFILGSSQRSIDLYQSRNYDLVNSEIVDDISFEFSKANDQDLGLIPENNKDPRHSEVFNDLDLDNVSNGDWAEDMNSSVDDYFAHKKELNDTLESDFESENEFNQPEPLDEKNSHERHENNPEIEFNNGSDKNKDFEESFENVPGSDEKNPANLNQLNTKAQKPITDLSHTLDDAFLADEDENYLDKMGDSNDPSFNSVYVHKISLKVRQLSVNLLSLLISVHPEHQRFPIKPYFRFINEFAIEPRVLKLSVENTQGESSLLDLINNMCKFPDTIDLLFHTNTHVFPNMISLLSAKKLSDLVSNRILDILSGLIGLEAYYQTSNVNDPNIISIREDAISCIKFVLSSNSGHIISQIQHYLTANYNAIKTKNRILSKLVFILSNIAEYVSSKSPGELSMLLGLLLPFLNTSGSKNLIQLSEKSKYDVLKLLDRFIPMLFCESNDPDYNPKAQFDFLFNFVSKLFMFKFQNKENRVITVKIFSNLANHYSFFNQENDLLFVNQVITDLNSYSVKRLDEPDFDKRLETFNNLNEKWFNHPKLIGSKAWLPLLSNLLYFSKDELESSIRSNSVYGISRFIDTVALRISEGAGDDYVNLIENVLWPDITKSLAYGSFLIKQENLKILGILVTALGSKIELLSDLVTFTSDDEESSFFFNALHIQVHRRRRALVRFCAKLNSDNPFKQNTLTRLFIPFFESILFGLELQTFHDLVSDLINTLSEISKKLTFANYFTMIKRYMNKKSNGSERVLTRLIISVLQSFRFDLRVPSNDENAAHIKKMTNQVEKVLLPHLKDYLSLAGTNFETQQDREDALLLRIPVSVSYVKILKLCPETIMNSHLPYLLMILCGILKVRRQETRDTTRATLAKILEILGPNYFGFVLDSLTSTLQKGFMKHVLCYTINYFLSHIKYEPGSLDYAMKKTSDVFIKSMFDNIKDENKSLNNTYKETRTGIKKSPISLELLAQIVGINSISVLLSPLIEILNITNSVTTIKQVKNCLHHISSGLIKNRGLFPKQKKSNSFEENLSISEKSNEDDTAESSEEISGNRMDVDIDNEVNLNVKVVDQNNNLIVMLQFIFALVLNHLNFEATKSVYVKNMVVKKAVPETSNLKTNSNIVVEFGLQLLLSIFKSGNLQFSSKRIPDIIINELKKFVDLIGNCLFSNHDGVVLLSLRISSFLIKFKSGSLLSDSELKIIIKRCLQMLKTNSNSKSPVTISSLQLISTIFKTQGDLRNSIQSDTRRKMLMTKTQLDFMVSLIKPDLEVEEFQSVSFSLLSGIIENKLISNDLYDLMDNNVQNMMIKSYSKFVRSQCRACLLRFYINYPITVKRLSNLINFVLSNVDGFELQTGRESGLEFLYSVIDKLPVQVVTEMYEEIFVKLVMALVNENDQNLVEMISLILKKLFVKMDQKQLDTSIELVSNLVDKSTINSLTEFSSPEIEKKLILWKASLQIFGISIECVTEKSDDNNEIIVSTISNLIPQIIEMILFTLAKTTVVWKKCEQERVDIDIDEFSDSKAIVLWQQGYLALKLLDKLMKFDFFNEFRKSVVNSEKVLRVQFPVIWELVAENLTYPHSWNRLMSSRLLGTYFSLNRLDENSRYLPFIKSETVKVSKILGLEPILSQNTSKLVELNMFSKSNMDTNYIMINFTNLIKVAYLSTVQLNSANLDETLGSQIVKNLFFVSKLIYQVSDHSMVNMKPQNQRDNIGNSEDCNESMSGDEDDNFDDELSVKHKKSKFDPKTIEKGYGFLWLIRRVMRVANYELIKFSKSTIRRKMAFQFIAAVVSIMSKDNLSLYLKLIISPIYKTNTAILNANDYEKEVVNNVKNESKKKGDKKFKNKPAVTFEESGDLSGDVTRSDMMDLSELCEQVLTIIRQLVGNELVNQTMNNLSIEANERKFSRKIRFSTMKLEDPEKYAEIKIAKNLVKKRQKNAKNKENASKRIKYSEEVKFAKQS
ncbi:U3 small nucleolar RNA-associated protein 20 [Smittium mucronatum]|uniref:U3 small nucleolar RNA-associated protein 20 n=1 Tax=Smittium mucronatum TaxID=133383 RepID=A0A1R0GXY5_9FUNG|nr:U3 small nucleolar RNA-associated protein 20 [Smittium mucronatum]